MFPADYNGIVSGSPAINATEFLPSELWPDLVMLQSNDFLPTCKEQAFTDAVIAACGDGSGVIENPAACRFNPFTLVGEVTPCGTITAADAAVMAKIWQGPVVDGRHLSWYGLEPGTSLSDLAATATSDGTTSPEPFPLPVGWFAYFLTQNPSFNWETLTYQQFLQYFEAGVSKFAVIGTDSNPDLSAFERDGGKILIWHGLADEIVFPQGRSSTTSESRTPSARRARPPSPGCSSPPARSTARPRPARRPPTRSRTSSTGWSTGRPRPPSSPPAGPTPPPRPRSVRCAPALTCRST